MHILADENIASQLVVGLRAESWDVDWIAESQPSIPDDKVIQIAKTKNRILPTSDVELASRTLRLPAWSVPTILVRMGTMPPAHFAVVLITTLKKRTDWQNVHAVLTPQKLRVKMLIN
jgi:predicted nuclease of predicted toxin-antitoxin system